MSQEKNKAKEKKDWNPNTHKSFLQKNRMENEKGVDKVVKLKGFQVETPRKNIHLNTSRLVNSKFKKENQGLGWRACEEKESLAQTSHPGLEVLK